MKGLIMYQYDGFRPERSCSEYFEKRSALSVPPWQIGLPRITQIDTDEEKSSVLNCGICGNIFFPMK
jgi:hypothetical protein